MSNWRGRGGGGRGRWRGRGRGRGGSTGSGAGPSHAQEDDTVTSVPETPPTRLVPRGGGAGRGGFQQRNVPTIPTPPPPRPEAPPNPHSYGWGLYFPHSAFDEDGEAGTLVRSLKEYCRAKPDFINKATVEKYNGILIDYQDLITECVGALAGLPDELRERPAYALACFGFAAFQVVYAEPTMPPLFTRMPPKLYVRIYNYDKITPVRKLKSNSIGRFVSIRGTVIRVSNVKPMVTRMAFVCNKCMETHPVSLVDGKYAPPLQCIGDCKSKQFQPDRASPITSTIDWQTVRVQEIISDDSADAGRIPRTIECELVEGLVDSCIPGDVVTVAGEVKVTAAQEGVKMPQSKAGTKNMFVLYLLANSVSNARSMGTGSVDIMEFSLQDLYAIQEIQNQPRLFALLINSLCPSIYGHETVKAGISLTLFGGRHRGGGGGGGGAGADGGAGGGGGGGATSSASSSSMPIRSDPHILIVGDPGLGKSQMLQAATSVMPRGVYVCGNTATTSGLTVTMIKEGGSGDYALEAGALVLGDQGCCCIDEFDKMGAEHNALLEAMEQQSISIAKAGIVCSLPARTSIIAAANPVGGHYNKAKTVSENLRMGSALLSRFDLVFILLDKPDEEMDRLLSEHVMAIHAGKVDLSRRARATAASLATSQHVLSSSQLLSLRGEDAGVASSPFFGSRGGATASAAAGPAGAGPSAAGATCGVGGAEGTDETSLSGRPLLERLKYSDLKDPIPSALLRKYIAYARKYVHPRLSSGASKVLQDFYVDLRRKYQKQDSTPITTRQLESLIRLAEARARLELRERVTVEDAEDVVEIMRNSMCDVFSDGTGGLAFDRSQNGTGMSKQAMVKRFVAILGRKAEETGKNRFSLDDLRHTAGVHGIRPQTSFLDLVDTMNAQGYLLKKPGRTYQLRLQE